MITQFHWRAVGVILLALSALMAGGATHLALLRVYGVAFIIYWTVFGAALVGAIVIAFIDLRYIRAQYAVARRELFLSTMGGEKHRQAIRQAQEELKRRETERGQRE